ncbi:MAG: NAD(P)H-hydrate epimerase [Cypionkella sp.]
MSPAEVPVLTAAQMRAAEQALVERGVSIEELMQRAGRGAAEWVWRIAAGRPVTVLCGPGNNGGDGYVIAETLRVRGLAVSVIAPEEPRTDAARAAHAAWKGPVHQEEGHAHGGVLVDCLFGSGLVRPLGAKHERLLEVLCTRHPSTIAVDLPSGAATDDGALLGAVPRCDLTLALGAWKPAHFLMPARGVMGEVRLVEIGVAPPADAAELFARPRLAAPARGAHKYSRGYLAVGGGAMPGAAVLAASAAMRGGAGYVKLLVDRPVAGAPHALVIDQRPLADALRDPRWSAALVGPGLGRDEAARARLAATLELPVPMVLDADALHLVDDDMLEGVDPARLLLTPHDGELARLCATFGISAEGKAAQARALAGRTGLTVLAKGPDTLLAAADGRLAFFHRSPSWLASAGTGDVLAGIAASRLATGVEPFCAAGEAVWLHGEAARIAGRRSSPTTLSAPCQRLTPGSCDLARADRARRREGRRGDRERAARPAGRARGPAPPQRHARARAASRGAAVPPFPAMRRVPTAAPRRGGAGGIRRGPRGARGARAGHRACAGRARAPLAAARPPTGDASRRAGPARGGDRVPRGRLAPDRRHGRMPRAGARTVRAGRPLARAARAAARPVGRRHPVDAGRPGG